MDVGLILKIAGIGLLVSVIGNILSKSGRDDYSSYCSIAGIIIVLIMLISEIKDLFNLVLTCFGL